MLVLFDYGTPKGLAQALPGQGFDLLLTTDRRIRYQQNLRARRIARACRDACWLSQAMPQVALDF